MKFLVLCSIVIVSTLSVPHKSFEQEWNSFKIDHNKQYPNAIEEIRRMAIFKQNLAAIEAHNANFLSITTHTKKINQFGDWTKEEFLKYVNRNKLTKTKSDKKNLLHWTSADIPVQTNVDWRTKAVTGVKDQGQCGSCWSFSATGSLEGQLALKGKGLISLSEQNLMDCSSTYGNDGCNGGWMDNAFNYIHDSGIMSEEAYPYEGANHFCRFNASKSITSLKGYYDIPKGNESELQKAVAYQGPISVAIDATDELQFYAQGILHDTTCDENALNHGVLAVGYGSEDGKDYWIIKNSWGSSWGDKGYYKAARNKNNNCGIATSASYPLL